MKKLIILIITLFITSNIYSQDLIITNSHDTIKCYIQSVNDDFIFYRMTPHSDIYRSLNVSDIDTFLYENQIKKSVVNLNLSQPIIDSIGSLRTEEYCMILGTYRWLSNSVEISIDFGQFVPLFKNKDFLRDSNGDKIKFNSMIDALNYMNGYGWEFVNAYAVTISNQNVYHWVLRRKIIKK